MKCFDDTEVFWMFTHALLLFPPLTTKDFYKYLMKKIISKKNIFSLLLAFEILLDREDMVNGPLSHGPQPTGVSWGGKQFLHVPSFCFPLRSVSFCLWAASGFRSMPDPQWKTESASILTCPRATLNKQGAGVAQIPEPLQGLCSIESLSRGP